MLFRGGGIKESIQVRMMLPTGKLWHRSVLYKVVQVPTSQILGGLLQIREELDYLQLGRLMQKDPFIESLFRSQQCCTHNPDLQGLTKLLNEPDWTGSLVCRLTQYFCFFTSSFSVIETSNAYGIKNDFIKNI